MKQNNNNIVIILLVLIIIILTTLCVLFATNTISLNSKTNNNNTNNETKVEENQQIENNNSNNNYTIEAMTSAKIDLLWNNENYDINIVNGKLKVNDKTFSISNENIKYFYYQRYQSSRSTVFHYLTKNGNIYVTEFTMENGIESFNNFKKLNYSNVTDIVVLPNEHYGKTYDETSGIIDNGEKYLYALIDGETLQLDYQYNY